MPGTSTYTSRVTEALWFKSLAAELWWSIGRTTAWPIVVSGVEIPPDPDPTDTGIEEVVGYKFVDEVETCRLDNASGTIIFHDNKYSIVSDPDDAYTMDAHYVYIKGTISYDELPVDISYRQIGLQYELVPAVAGTALLPAEVSDPGKLLYIANTSPTFRAIDKKEEISVILEMS